MKVVLAGHTSALGNLPVGSHHLARALVDAGHTVVHLSAPMSPAHLLYLRDPMVRVRLRRPVVEVDGYHEITPWLPAPGRALEWAPQLADRLWRVAVPRLRPAIDRLGGWPVDLLVVDYPYAAGLPQVLEPTRSVYRATDVYPELRERPRIEAVERRLIDQVDALVATSGPVARHLERIDARGRRATIIPNAAAVARGPASAATRRLVEDLPDPVAVYAGAVDERFDGSLLDDLVRSRPDVSFLVVGPGSSGLTDRPNLRRHGPVPHADLMSLLPLCRVGLVLTNDHPGNEGRSPIKLFEYRAAGLEVVARRTTEVARLDLPGLHPYDGPEEAGRRLDDALLRPTGDGASVPTWSDRAEQLLRAVGA